jgi:hypothetical protein
MLKVIPYFSPGNEQKLHPIMPAIHSAAIALAAAALLAGLAGVTWDGDIVWEPVVRDTSPTPAEGPRETGAYVRSTVTFPLNGGKEDGEGCVVWWREWAERLVWARRA